MLPREPIIYMPWLGEISENVIMVAKGRPKRTE